jgi:hypothetical protein
LATFFFPYLTLWDACTPASDCGISSLCTDCVRRYPLSGRATAMCSGNSETEMFRAVRFASTCSVHGTTSRWNFRCSSCDLPRTHARHKRSDRERTRETERERPRETGRRAQPTSSTSIARSTVHVAGRMYPKLPRYARSYDESFRRLSEG